MPMIIQAVELDRFYSSTAEDIPYYLRPYIATVTFADADASYNNIKVPLTADQVTEVLELMISFARSNINTNIDHFIQPTYTRGSDGRNHTDDLDEQIAKESLPFDEEAAYAAAEADEWLNASPTKQADDDTVPF